LLVYFVAWALNTIAPKIVGWVEQYVGKASPQGENPTFSSIAGERVGFHASTQPTDLRIYLAIYKWIGGFENFRSVLNQPIEVSQ
jgi:hypothetical protein